MQLFIDGSQATPTGATAHNELCQLLNDDHTQYVLADGTRTMDELTVTADVNADTLCVCTAHVAGEATVDTVTARVIRAQVCGCDAPVNASAGMDVDGGLNTDTLSIETTTDAIGLISARSGIALPSINGQTYDACTCAMVDSALSIESTCSIGITTPALTIDGNVEVCGCATMQDNLTVNGTINATDIRGICDGPAVLNTGAEVSCGLTTDTLTVTGDTDLRGTLNVASVEGKTYDACTCTMVDAPLTLKTACALYLCGASVSVTGDVTAGDIDASNVDVLGAIHAHAISGKSYDEGCCAWVDAPLLVTVPEGLTICGPVDADSIEATSLSSDSIRVSSNANLVAVVAQTYDECTCAWVDAPMTITTACGVNIVGPLKHCGSAGACGMVCYGDGKLCISGGLIVSITPDGV